MAIRSTARRLHLHPARASRCARLCRISAKNSPVLQAPSEGSASLLTKQERRPARKAGFFGVLSVVFFLSIDKTSFIKCGEGRNRTAAHPGFSCSRPSLTRGNPQLPYSQSCPLLLRVVDLRMLIAQILIAGAPVIFTQSIIRLRTFFARCRSFPAVIPHTQTLKARISSKPIQAI